MNVGMFPDYRQCYSGEFRCNNSECIMAAYLCDGEAHCKDASDEYNCGQSAILQSSMISMTDINKIL